MNELLEYAREIVQRAGKVFSSGEVFAKVLTTNDDSGRHGVLVPTDAYSYFPNLPIPNATQNATVHFSAIDAASSTDTILAYKYYHRYPERRITRLPSILNETFIPRILVFLRATHRDGSSAYYFDCAAAAPNGRFWSLVKLIFSEAVEVTAGRFVVRPVDSAAFVIDEVLSELLSEFDNIREKGWITSLREGHTGIGYTFETLLGIKENNDQLADYKGIEIKCKGVKEGDRAGTGKINLFQAGPTWLSNSTSRERIRMLGRAGMNGLYACHSQVTTTPNNLGLLLRILSADSKIDLEKSAGALGYWTFETLEKRLLEKHSRAVFINAETRRTKTRTLYSYKEVVYCDRPSITRFVDLVSRKNIVFEFLMSENVDSTIRNHGYPWRLTRAEFLNALFSFQIRLR